MYCMSLLFNIIYITFSSIVRNVHFSIFPFVNHLHRKTFDSLNFGKIVFIDSYEKIFYIGNDRKIGKTKFNFVSSLFLALDTILFYAKSVLKRFIFTVTLFFWLLFLLSIVLVSKIKVFPILFIISVMLTLFYFYIHIRIKSLENINKHFEVKEIF